MKTLRNFLIRILLISFLTLFTYSCSLEYYKSGYTLQDAVTSQLKTKIVTKEGKREFYNRIILDDDGQYVGKNKIKGKQEWSEIVIDTNAIKKVKLENEKLNSTAYGIVYVVTFITMLVLATVYVYPLIF